MTEVFEEFMESLISLIHGKVALERRHLRHGGECRAAGEADVPSTASWAV